MADEDGDEIVTYETWIMMFAWLPRNITCRTTGKVTRAWLKTIGKRQITLSGCGTIMEYYWGEEYYSKEDALIAMLSGPKVVRRTRVEHKSVWS